VTFVDTSGFYAVLSGEDRDHEAVTCAFRAQREGGERLVACSYVIAETMGLVQHRLGLGVLTRFVEDMLPLIDIRWVGPAEHAAASALLFRVRRRSFTIVDAASAAAMTRDGAQAIIALDPEFVRLGFKVLPGKR
jgi:predicted nucleic acid-binding protein